MPDSRPSFGCVRGSRTANQEQVRRRLQALFAAPPPEADVDRPDSVGADPPDPPDEAGRRFRLDPSRRGVVAMLAVAVVAVLVVGVLMWRSRPTAQPVAAASSLPSFAPTPPAPVTSPSASGRIAVAVAGRVRHPGVVELPAGSRVDDAIAAAGGLAPGAHLGLLNLAKVLSDGEQVVVGIPGVTGDSGSGPAASGDPAGPVNLNTATLEQLDSLPGVGPSTAQKILDWRTANGPFQSVDQLQDVSGIGPAKFAEIAPKVTL